MINDMTTMSDEELDSHFSSLDSILALAEPWLIDSGEIIVDQTLSESARSGWLREQSKALLDRYLTGQQSIMKVLLCDRFDYCAKKKRYRSRVELAKAITDSLCMALTAIPIPLILIAAYIIEEGYCERLCKCNTTI